MTYKFRGCVYRSQEEMLDAIAYEWLSWGGWKDTEERHRILARFSDEELAQACISAMGLDLEAPNGYGEEIASYMEEYGYGEEELAEAFTRLRGVMCGNVVTSVA